MVCQAMRKKKVAEAQKIVDEIQATIEEIPEEDFDDKITKIEELKEEVQEIFEIEHNTPIPEEEITVFDDLIERCLTLANRFKKKRKKKGLIIEDDETSMDWYSTPPELDEEKNKTLSISCL